MPLTIFVTAYDRYALKAFEVNAMDYLVKPFDKERFQKALERVRHYLQRPGGEVLEDKLVALLENVKTERKTLDRLVIKEAGRIYFGREEEIEWIEAAGNYARLHVGKEAHLLRETMNGLEGKLNTDKFLRIHRSTIVNIERVRELQPLFHGDYVVLL